MAGKIEETVIDVVLVNMSQQATASLKLVSQEIGCRIVAAFSSIEALKKEIDACETDVILINGQQPMKEALKSIEEMLVKRAQPVVVFSDDDDSELIQNAVKIGVSAYIVDDFNVDRVRSIIDVAMARFECFKQLESELSNTQVQLVERKQIDRAKGLLMDQYAISEEKAYGMMRKAAMDSNLKIADVAASIITSAISRQ